MHSYGLYPFTKRTITRETELRKELKRIRRQGFAVDDEETTPGGQCFGAPIFSQWNEALAAISVSAPKIRITSKERRQEIIEAVKAAAGRISRALAAGS